MLRSAALSLTLVLGACPLAPATASAQTAVESRVAASADDAEEAESGSVSLIGSDLELGWDGSPQTLGMRFPSLAVPQGAHVLAAWVQFEADEANSTSVTLSFTAQASDDAASFTTATNDLTSRPRAAASVPWTPPPWTTPGEAGPDQRTPDLSPLVQAVVDRPGWASGNALALFVEGPDSGNGRRIASSWNGHASGAPLLHVEYDLADVNDPPVLTVLSPSPMAQFPADEPVTLSASASDPEDGDLGAAVLWSSSLDGVVGIGASVVPSLSVGIHTLTAEVADAEGLVASQSLDVRVTAEGHVLLAAGDIASCNTALGDEATGELLDDHFGTILGLGDIAYPDGSLEDFANCFEPSWGRHKARIRPVPGNHEHHIDGAADYFSYFGAAAGEPPGWYSFDVGSWHVVMLNSNCSEIGGCNRDDPQALWLEADLAANPRDCTLAVTHHARFSSGESHGSNDRLTDLYDIFHSHGGDLILSGHDHHYERFAPQDAFGVADASGPRQFVVGTGGGSLRGVGELEPNSIAHGSDLFGVLALTLNETSYAWEFLPAAGFEYADSGSASCVGSGTDPVNQPPEVAITEPLPGSVFDENAPVSFVGSASDPEDGSLSAGLHWTSSQDGAIGTGASFITSALSVGVHEIEARVEDSQGVPGVAAASLEVRVPNTVTIEKRIATGSDDAEQLNSGTHDVQLHSVDLELVEDGDEQLVGLRFDDLEIPRRVQILDAWLQFQADGSSSGAAELEIRAQASDDAPTFSRDRHDLSDRPLAAASASWSPSAWSSGNQGEGQRSPSLVDVVQEVVDREGWASGNALALIVGGDGLRRAESFDGAASAAPLLHVSYRVPSPPPGNTGGCGIGPELGVAVPAVAWLRRWRRRASA